MPSAATPPRLETLTEWLNASLEQRKRNLESCLELIRAADPSIRAWVQVLPQRPTGDGALSEIPFGAKDVLETRGLATEYGSPVYRGRIGTEDAAIIRDLRQRGAILLGKTHCAAFAYFDPAPTHNPRNLEHTPGGSSSGSAAAVAAGMVPFAIGTQTLGSILRPASYCGVTGFKPTYDLLPMEGVLPFSKSLDTLGFFTHTAADMRMLWESIGQDSGQPEDFPLGAPDPMPDVESVMAEAFRNALDTLRKRGISIRTLDMAGMLAKLWDAAKLVMSYEGARFHRSRWEEYGDRLGRLANLVREGSRIGDAQYTQAQRYIADCRIHISELYKATPVIIVPAATGPAPRGLASTGDPRMNAPWTALGTPAISIPMPAGSALPLGLQVTADQGQDARVLHTAARLEKLLVAG